ncbi:MAG: hypothetical protein DHS20C21_00970 [Gemmatimonadota bacterium]|nr:MAG: hypothetical protein DHS20C21_00970 [Gemmatimonadota bacterium]
MIGKTLAHYKIVEKIGSGGMGDVYRARDTKLDRDIAIKILPATLAQDPERLSRFEREAKTVAGLNHPHIVTLHSVEREGDQHYITMELVEGRTLSAAIPENGLPLDRLLDLGTCMADAVASAHRNGVTHRDLKPDNIMINAEGRLKVLDFGLAKLQDEAGTTESEATVAGATNVVTGEGRILGTPAYMSPEQAEGKPADHRSDVFAMGVILYEMATGIRPFQGDTPMSTITAILRDTPSPISSLNQRLPRHLGRIVKRCLEKDPGRRYQTALDVKNELENLREEITSGEITVPAAGPAAGGGGGRKGLVAVLGVVAVASVAFGVSQWLARGSAPPSASAPLQEMEIRRLTATGNTRAPAISGDGRHVAYVVDESGSVRIEVMQIATGSRIQVTPPEVADLRELTYSPDGDFLYYLRQDLGAENRDLFRVPALGGRPRKVVDKVRSGISFSPDGERIVFVRALGDGRELLVIARLKDGVEETLEERIGSQLGEPSWSPDGRTIVAPEILFVPRYRARLWLYDLERKEGSPASDREWWGLDDVHWFPEGNGLVFSGRPDVFTSNLWSMTVPGGDVQRITNDLNDYTDLSLTADGRSMVSGQGLSSYDLWTVPLAGEGTARNLTNASRALIWVTAWRPDGTILYSTATTTTLSVDIWKVNADGGAPEQVTSWPEVEFHVAANERSRTMVFSSNRGGPINLWRTDSSGGDPVRLTDGTFNSHASIPTNGEWVFYVDFQSSRMMKMPLHGGKAVPVSDARSNAGAVSPDGTLVAMNTWYGAEERWRIDIVPADGGAPTKTLDLPVTDLVVWTPDGTALLYDQKLAGVDNVWRAPIDGSEPEQLTHFDEEGTDLQAWVMSPDGTALAVSVGRTTEDIVLIENFR